MGTRSSITVRTRNDIYLSIYCHWDGYLKHNGKILQEHYNTQEKVEKLISLGDISSLAESCEKPEGHSFDNRVEGYTVYYGRDRGEDDVAPRKCYFLREVMEKNRQEYNYFWDGDRWHVAKEVWNHAEERAELDDWIPLEEALKQIG